MSCSRQSWRLGFGEAPVCLGGVTLSREPAEASLVEVVAAFPEICIDTQNQYMHFKGLYTLSCLYFISQGSGCRPPMPWVPSANLQNPRIWMLNDGWIAGYGHA